MIRRAVAWMRNRLEKTDDTFSDELMTCEQLARVLQIERQRADRLDTQFSLIVYAAASDESRDETLSALAEILRKRSRATDQSGWLPAGRLGTVLSTTSSGGAWTVANDVCRQLPENVTPPVCSVHTYPSDFDVDGDSEWGAGEEMATNAPERRGASQTREQAGPVVAMEPLFIMKTPFWKRVLDIAGASAGLVVFAPLFACVAAAIKLTMPGPVFFIQMRSGVGGRRFKLYKFRSMIVDAEAKKQALQAQNEQDGPAFKIKNDPRVTRLGRFLRSTSIDELPQLLNVLLGDMSLVGPRPLPCAETAECDRWHKHRLDVVPGVTCIWQVRGRSRTTFDEWMRMDLEYARSRGLLNDIGLILKTLPAVLSRRGAH